MQSGAATEAPTTLYSKLKEHVLDRDQIGTSDIFYDLVRAERPLPELLRETVHIHAPYTHFPYHQRIDNGYVRFVNNDHCLLSARASLRLPEFIPDRLRYLPNSANLVVFANWAGPLESAVGEHAGTLWPSDV